MTCDGMHSVNSMQHDDTHTDIDDRNSPHTHHLHTHSHSHIRSIELTRREGERTVQSLATRLCVDLEGCTRVLLRSSSSERETALQQTIALRVRPGGHSNVRRFLCDRPRRLRMESSSSSSSSSNNNSSSQQQQRQQGIKRALLIFMRGGRMMMMAGDGTRRRRRRRNQADWWTWSPRPPEECLRRVDVLSSGTCGVKGDGNEEGDGNKRD